MPGDGEDFDGFAGDDDDDDDDDDGIDGLEDDLCESDGEWSCYLELNYL